MIDIMKFISDHWKDITLVVTAGWTLWQEIRTHFPPK